MLENPNTRLFSNLFNNGKQLLLIAEERTLESMKEKPPPFEVVGWLSSFYEADRWVRANKRHLVQRRYLNVERSDPKWSRARDKGQIKIT